MTKYTKTATTAERNSTFWNGMKDKFPYHLIVTKEESPSLVMFNQVAESEFIRVPMGHTVNWAFEKESDLRTFQNMRIR